MNFTINDIINDIKNEGFWEKCEKTYNDHLISYKLTKNSLKNDKECSELLNDFMTQFFLREKKDEANEDSRHVYGYVAIDYFKRLYKEKTTQIIYDQMKTGVDGGVYSVFKRLIDLMIKDSLDFQIKRKISYYISDLEIEEKIKLADEYIEKYSYYLPKQYLTMPVVVAVRLEEILLEHIQLEKKIRDTSY